MPNRVSKGREGTRTVGWVGVSGGLLNPRLHALGKSGIDPLVAGRSPSPLTNASRKLVIGDPRAKKDHVIFLMSTRRSPSYMERVGYETPKYNRKTWRCNVEYLIAAYQFESCPKDSRGVESRLVRG